MSKHILRKFVYLDRPLGDKSERIYAIAQLGKVASLRLKVGDYHYSGAGMVVLVSGIITKISPVIKITNIRELNTAKNIIKFAAFGSNESKETEIWWSEQEDKFINRNPKNRPLYILYYTVNPIDIKPFVWGKEFTNVRNSFEFYDDTDEIKKEIFQFRNVSVEERLLELGNKKSLKFYTEVSPLARKETCDLYKVYNGSDLDHVVPQSVGGAGIIRENLVPVSPSENSEKGNSIPKEFILVSGDYDEFKNSIPNQSHQDRRTTFEYALKVVSKVRSWDIPKQRIFYKDITKQVYPNSKFMI